MDRYDLQTRYLDLTRTILPSLGRTRGWVAQEGHCFMRIVLDHVFADCWYNHVDKRLRAYKQLNSTQLAQAVAIAERMAIADAESISRMNTQSLVWRQKPVKLHPTQSAQSSIHLST